MGAKSFFQIILHALFSFIVLFILLQCRKDKPSPPKEDPTYNPTPYSIKIPKFFPTKLYIPDDNPMTIEGIELGRYLFYDGRFSGRNDTLMSCASCHKQKYSFPDRLHRVQYC